MESLMSAKQKSWHLNPTEGTLLEKVVWMTTPHVSAQRSS